ncbi:hypothetical protein [Clostridium butyricum]|uniref:hypothetical protein n=1 Tax=Clostridium butyricum TaxID=1492 RepID=UPI0022E91990|nr:hypothetical protein [Clostridium butyricum]
MSCKITINGKEFNFPKGKIDIKNRNIYVDGENIKNIFSNFSDSVVNISVYGDVNNIDCNGYVKVKGNVNGNIDSNGDISISGNHVGEIDTCGDVVINKRQ